MVCQSIAVPNARGVEQKGVKNVLICVSAVIIYKQIYTAEVLSKIFFKTFLKHNV